MKLSEDVEKVSIPGKKNLYRLYGHDGNDSLITDRGTKLLRKGGNIVF